MNETTFNNKLRMRIKRVSTSMVGKNFLYYPISQLRRVGELENGAVVKITEMPKGKGKYKLVEIEKCDRYGDTTEEKYNVILNDLVKIIGYNPSR